MEILRDPEIYAFSVIISSLNHNLVIYTIISSHLTSYHPHFTPHNSPTIPLLTLHIKYSRIDWQPLRLACLFHHLNPPVARAETLGNKRIRDPGNTLPYHTNISMAQVFIPESQPDSQLGSQRNEYIFEATQVSQPRFSQTQNTQNTTWEGSQLEPRRKYCTSPCLLTAQPLFSLTYNSD